MKHNIEYTHKNIKLGPITPNDIEQLRLWRNDNSLTKYLSQIDYIAKEKQEDWYRKDLENSDCYSFAISETKELNTIIGSVALYNFNKNSAEFGRLFIGDVKARGMGYGYIVTSLCIQIAFNEFNLDEVFAYVHKQNSRALSAYKKVGFETIENHSESELKIAINKSDFWDWKRDKNEHNTGCTVI